MSELITMDGEYVTRDGREVRIWCVDANGGAPYPVRGESKSREGEWVYCFWTRDGRYGANVEHRSDLVPKPKRHKRTVYINVYQDNGDYYLHSSRTSADVSSATRCGAVRSDKRIACLELHLDFAEGEGLEP